MGHADPTAAEVTSTAPCVTFPREAFLSLVEQRASLNTHVLEKGLLQARSRAKHGDLSVLLKRIGLIYGYRGTDLDLRYLSPYEFVRHWLVRAIDAAKMPRRSTATVKIFDAEVVPAELARSWVLMRKARPDVPKFHGCPMPKSGRGAGIRTARILLTYFHPWTLVDAWSCEDVPHVSRLGAEGFWQESCETWLNGKVLTEEMRRVITNFLSATRARPRDREIAAENSDEAVSDKELFLGEEDLRDVLVTKPGGRDSKHDTDGHRTNAIAAIERVKEL